MWEAATLFPPSTEILLHKHIQIAHWRGVTVIKALGKESDTIPSALVLNHQIFTITLWWWCYSYFHFNGKETEGVLTWGLLSWESQQCQQQLGHQLRPSYSTLNLSNIQATRRQPVSCLLGKVQHCCCYFWALLGKVAYTFLSLLTPSFFSRLDPHWPSHTHSLPTAWGHLAQP